MIALINKQIEKINKYLQQNIKYTETEEGLKQIIQWEGKQYKTNAKEKITKHFIKQADKEKSNIIKHFETINNANAPIYNYIISVEWNKNHNCTATNNFNQNTAKTNGYGYDKLSTAVSQILNKEPRILKKLYEVEEKRINEYPNASINENIDKYSRRNIIGCGSGYNILPIFEGGVGINSIIEILKTIGFNVKHYDTKTSDIIIINEEAKQ